MVTLVTPTGDFGGPVRVAVNQAAALRAQGHEVVVIAAARGYEGEFPTDVEGVPVRLFPARTALPGTGFAGLRAAGMRRWIREHRNDFDVAHIHIARDLVTLPAADLVRRLGLPYVLQPHGMIDPSSNPLAAPLDAALTRRVLRDAAAVFYLTPVEKEGLAAVGGGDLDLMFLGNGVPEQPAAGTGPTSGELEVLFLARIAPRKRPTAFVDAAAALAPAHPDVRFRLVGPDEGEGGAVTAAIAAAGLGDRLEWEGPIAPELSVGRLARASVYVLPSVDEPFPMSVLEAMSLGKPVVITDTCGLAPFVAETGSGIVVDDSIEQLTAAIDALISDPTMTRSMGNAAAEATRERMSMAAVARSLAETYSAAGSSRR
ncbi:glycosyltransferase [Amnibacterium flavum]|uniref:glycosyltransferase n=1 Tax=Amnibacterium flavum TaxID=2173173 RepID=UPI00196B7EA2|nr:glycosyltransferase [Amnibacterium flavum]